MLARTYTLLVTITAEHAPTNLALEAWLETALRDCGYAGPVVDVLPGDHLSPTNPEQWVDVPERKMRHAALRSA